MTSQEEVGTEQPWGIYTVRSPMLQGSHGRAGAPHTLRGDRANTVGEACSLTGSSAPQTLTTLARALLTATSISSAAEESLGEPHLYSMGSSPGPRCLRLLATIWMARIHSSLCGDRSGEP